LNSAERTLAIDDVRAVLAEQLSSKKAQRVVKKQTFEELLGVQPEPPTSSSSKNSIFSLFILKNF